MLTKQRGVVPGMVGRWHHLILLSLEILNPGEISVMDHYGHLEYLVLGNHKEIITENTYDSLEI